MESRVKSTKYCPIVVHLRSGTTIGGTLHIPITTGSTVRPSDAIRECQHRFLQLTDATVNAIERSAILVHVEAIEYVELPEKGWIPNVSEPPAY